jgi:hypothetical protein
MYLKNIHSILPVFLFLSLLCWPFLINAHQITIKSEWIDTTTQKITFSLPMQQKDFIYKDFITFSLSDLSLELSDWESTNNPIHYYDPLFKSTKTIFIGTVIISVQVTYPKKHSCKEAYLYCSYYQRSKKKMMHFKYPLPSARNNYSEDTTIEQPSAKDGVLHENNTNPHASYNAIGTIINALKQSYSPFENINTLNVCLMVLLVLLCIAPPYFFTKKIHTSIQLHELITIITATSFYILIMYIIFFIACYNRPEINRLLITICTGTIGIFYIKKSTIFQWYYLKHMTTVVGITLTATTVVLFFTTIQLFF